MAALGFIEIQGVVPALAALDEMAKAADVSLISWERRMGGRLVTLIVTGGVSAVEAAIEAACAKGIRPPKATLVLPRPHPETMRLVTLSACKMRAREELEDGTTSIGLGRDTGIGGSD